MFYNIITLPFFVANPLVVLWLLFINKSQKKISVITAVCLSIVFYCQVVSYGHLHPAWDRYTFYLNYTDALLFFLQMPLYYTYLRNLLENRPYLSHKNAIHLWPALLELIYCMFFYSIDDGSRISFVNFCWHGFIPLHLLYLIGCGSIIFYAIRSIMLIQKYIHQYHDKLREKSLRQLYLFVWMFFLIIMFSFSFFVSTVLNSNLTTVYHICLVIFLVANILQWGHLFIINPEKLEFINEEQLTLVLNREFRNTPAPSVDYSQHLRIIEKRMEENQLYLQKDLTLVRMAKICGIPTAQLSAILNKHYNKTFSNYINEYRIEKAKERLLSSSNCNFKIDFLADECGFASRSTFYSAFKKHTGTTPILFREAQADKRLLDEASENPVF
jgi:AraC-like DNA-binding protein